MVPAGGSSGSTPCATWAIASRAGSAGRVPVRAWPSLKRLRSAGRLRSGTAACRTASQQGHCQK
eukprot:608785-Lingulodinium_polyedra.AAC.1